MGGSTNRLPPFHFKKQKIICNIVLNTIQANIMKTISKLEILQHRVKYDSINIHFKNSP